jgi:hypothetical protein
MRRLLIVGGVLAACSGERSAPTSPVIARSQALADQLCACKDVTCADPIDRQWAALTAEIGRSQLADADIDGMARATQRYTRCLAKLPLAPAELVRHVRNLADQACKCGSDPACAAPLRDELDRRVMWTFSAQPTIAPAEQAELRQAMDAFAKCALAAGVEPSPK